MARILIIDDSQDLQQIMKLVLARHGHEICVASSGEEGLSEFGHHPTDLVIVDILMPGKGGLETIKDLQAAFNRPKVIAISGGFMGGESQAADLASTLGVDRTLAKPFAPDDLVKAVNELLGT